MNRAPTPTGGIDVWDQARPVLVACLWERQGEQVRDLTPAMALQRSGALVLCRFWDGRMDEPIEAWVEARFLQDRPPCPSIDF